jgi:hypothetical protein
MVSQANGGPDSLSNYITACRECNGGKGALSINAMPANTHTMRQLSESETYALASIVEPEQKGFLRACADLGINTILFE